MVKKVLGIYIFFWIIGVFSSQAQQIIKDSTMLQTWFIKDAFAKRRMTPPDTVPYNFQIDNPIYRESIGNTYDGNLGSPYLSQIFFKRNFQTNFLFMQPYNAYITFPQNHYFYNTKDPYTNFAYHSAGTDTYKEEYFNLHYTRNVTPHLNVEGEVYQYYGRGEYANQSTNHLGYNFSTNYISPTYNLYFTFGNTQLINLENGGIANDNYITNPENMNDKFTQPNQIPTNLANAKTKISNRNVFLAQSYNLNVKIKSKNDSLPPKVIPFASISHTFTYEQDEKIFTDAASDNLYYKSLNLYPSLDSATDDNTNYSSMKNTISLDINEEINRWAKFGMGGFMEYEARQYQNEQYLSDSIGLATSTQNYLVVGATIYKTQGTNLKYNGVLRTHIQGSKAGNLSLEGNLETAFKLWGKKYGVKASGKFANESPDVFQNYYYSNYFQWRNSFSNTITGKFSGEINGLPRNSRLYASVANISNYVYWGLDAKPTQNSGSVQVIEVGADLNFKLAPHLFWDNNVVFQKTSNAAVIPLPQVTAYTNFYYSDLLVKVLWVQLGIEGRYFTSYNAPAYMAPLGIYYNQNQMQLGAFPILTPYLNFHLKRMRFYVKWYHLNDTITPPIYFTSPHYPLNPNMVKIGFSWNFYT